MADIQDATRQVPLTLQVICRLHLMGTCYLRGPYSDTSGMIQQLGHAAKLGCLASLWLVKLRDLDLGSADRTDLEHFLSLIKYDFIIENVSNIRVLFSANQSLIPFGQERDCELHSRTDCSCGRPFKDFECICQGIWTPFYPNNVDFSLCTCRRRGLNMSLSGLTLDFDLTKQMVDFFKHVTEVRLGNPGDGHHQSHLHLDISSFVSSIGSLKQSYCQRLEINGDWRSPGCHEVNRHLTANTLRHCADLLGWDYSICDVSLAMWRPTYHHKSKCYCFLQFR